MSPASYLTAPPRVAAASISARGAKIGAMPGRRCSIEGMSIGIWSAVGFIAFVVVCGTVWAGVQALKVWREVRRVPGGILAQVDELSKALVALERRMANVE